MPGRAIPLVNGEYYHVYNRGADERKIFIQERDYKRFLKTIKYYQFSGAKPRLSVAGSFRLKPVDLSKQKKLVEIVCYCFMPNHFHLLVKQLSDEGISTFISKLANSYTRFFNTKYKRVGALFQGVFKSVPVESEEQLIHLSRYIHLNPIVSGVCSDIYSYPYSSVDEFLSGKKGFCSVGEILGYFSSIDDYKKFLEDHVEYATSLEMLKHKLIDV